ncbi:MAG: glucosamine-6-phosphate deaminase [Saprospiraceae bacterium]
MQLQLFDTHLESSNWLADQIVDAIIQKPNLTLCLASGDSPKLTYQIMVQRLIFKEIDYSKFHMLGLDEWVGISPDDTGSCAYFFHKYLIEPLALNKDQFHLFDGLSHDVDLECNKMDAIIKEKGIDLMVVGIGMNGHIGFNEPGTAFDTFCHIVQLDSITTSVGQKYFESSRILDKGITIGLGNLLDSKKVILIAHGEKKAKIISQTLGNEIGRHLPATIMKQHENACIIIDRLAANKW